MTIETEVAALTAATTDLLDAVNIRKTQLDDYIAGAQAAESAAAASETAAAASEAAASASATAAAASAGTAATEASEASASATAAASSATAAAASEAAAATSEDGAASAAAVAAASATAASASETAASNSAAAAAASAASIVGAEESSEMSAASAAASAIAAQSSKTAAEQASATAASAAASAVAVVTGGTASLTPAAGKIPLADASGRIAAGWLMAANHIGIPGQAGFGVGVCPSVPAGFTPMTGCSDPAADNYGNYTFADGSVMAWVPAFYYRIGHASNPTYASYGLDSVDVQPLSRFAGKAEAAAEGYALHRAFIDGGTVQPGFFFDKYMVSNNGGVASSLKNGNAISFHADHNPVSGLNGAPSNIYASAILAAKTRGAAFHTGSAFQYAALALLSLAHGQAATSATWCAWYDAAGNINFPKGCNNNALRDTNDSSVLYVSDGYSNCGKTGSASILAKTTHNGQACGIADLNGLMWEVAIGITCIATSKTVTAATQANPVQITAAAHGFTTGDEIMLTGIGGMTQITDRIFTITVVDANTFTLNGVDGTAFTAYTSGGSATKGAFHAAKEATAMRNFASGNSGATDHWGATGVAAMMEPLGFSPLRTDYPNNGFSRRVGDGANAALDPATGGAGYKRTALGVPQAAAMGASGINRFGQDYYYQYIRNELALIVSANWSHGSNAGVWARYWGHTRGNSDTNVGCRAASYL